MLNAVANTELGPEEPITRRRVAQAGTKTPRAPAHIFFLTATWRRRDRLLGSQKGKQKQTIGWSWFPLGFPLDGTQRVAHFEKHSHHELTLMRSWLDVVFKYPTPPVQQREIPAFQTWRAVYHGPLWAIWTNTSLAPDQASLAAALRTQVQSQRDIGRRQAVLATSRRPFSTGQGHQKDIILVMLTPYVIVIKPSLVIAGCHHFWRAAHTSL